MAGRGQAGSELSPGVEEVLVDRVAVGVKLEREHVDRDVVERDRDEDLALLRDVVELGEAGALTAV